MSLTMWTVRHIHWRLEFLFYSSSDRSKLKSKKEIFYGYGGTCRANWEFLYIGFSFYLECWIPSGTTKQKNSNNNWWNCNQRYVYMGHAGQEVQSAEPNVGGRASYTWPRIFSVSLWVNVTQPLWVLVSSYTQTCLFCGAVVVLEQVHIVCWIQSLAQGHFSISTNQCFLYPLNVPQCHCLRKANGPVRLTLFQLSPTLVPVQLFSTFHKQAPHIEHTFAFLNLLI